MLTYSCYDHREFFDTEWCCMHYTFPYFLDGGTLRWHSRGNILLKSGLHGQKLWSRNCHAILVLHRREQFRRSFRLGPTIIKQWCWSEGYRSRIPSVSLCHIVSLTTLQGHSARAHIQSQYQVYIFMLLTLTCFWESAAIVLKSAILDLQMSCNHTNLKIYPLSLSPSTKLVGYPKSRC